MIQSILLIIFLPISSSLSFRRSHANMSPIDDPTILASSLQQQFTDQNKPIDDTSTKASSQSTPRFSTSSKPKPEPGLDLPQARSPTHAPSNFNQLYIFGFDSDYYCSGRISDEPRKMRLSCTKNPQRLMNCQCDDQTGNSLTVGCRCTPTFSSTSKKLNLEDKFVAP